jgi:SpoIIAA-like
MLKLIPGLASNVIGIEAIGKVEAADYQQVLDPAAAQAIRQHDRVRLLYVLADEYEGYTAAAMWEDTKLGFHDLKAWERIAVVTDHDVLRDAIRVFGWLIPAEVRTYAVEELEDAKRWVDDDGPEG